jgi:aryl-alcohol dehydrogenase-like predicted oxidoreductase
VSPLGLGCGHLGSPAQGEPEIARLLDEALDAGITLIDTATSYGLSEERIGRHLRGRRNAFLLSTKGGYGVPGVPDWTGDAIRLGVDAALERLRTDRIDVFHLHSCDEATLAQDDIARALEDVVRAGKVRVPAYAGEEAPLAAAVGSGRFASVQMSINLCDQRGVRTIVPRAQAAGMGVIAKRPLANAPWRYRERPVGQYVEVYWERFHRMELDAGGLDWAEVAVRFAAHQPGVTSCIVGTSRSGVLPGLCAAVARGPLPPAQEAHIQDAFSRKDDDWNGQV